MRSMVKIVSEIANMNSSELQELARGLAWYSVGVSDKSEKLENFLNVYNREQRERFPAYVKESV